MESEKEVFDRQTAEIKQEKSSRRRKRRLAEHEAKRASRLAETAKMDEAKKAVVAPPEEPPPRPSEPEFREEPADFLVMSITPKAAKLYRKLMKELVRQGEE